MRIGECDPEFPVRRVVPDRRHRLFAGDRVQICRGSERSFEFARGDCALHQAGERIGRNVNVGGDLPPHNTVCAVPVSGIAVSAVAFPVGQKRFLFHSFAEVKQNPADETLSGNDPVCYAVRIVSFHGIVEFGVPERQPFAVFGDDPLDVPDRIMGGIRRMFLAGRVGVERDDVRILIAAEFAEFIQKIPHLPAEVACDVRGDDADRGICFPALFKRDFGEFDIIFRCGCQVGFIQNLPVPDAAFEVGNCRADIVSPVVKIRHDCRFAVDLQGGFQFAAASFPFRQIAFKQDIAENAQQDVPVFDLLIYEPVGEAEIEFSLFRFHGCPFKDPV